MNPGTCTPAARAAARSARRSRAIERAKARRGEAEEPRHLGARKHIGDGFACVGQLERRLDRAAFGRSMRPGLDAPSARAENNMDDLVGSATVFLSHLPLSELSSENDQNAARTTVSRRDRFDKRRRAPAFRRIVRRARSTLRTRGSRLASRGETTRNGERRSRRSAPIGKHASFHFHVNGDAVRTRSDGDFRAQAVERPSARC